MAASDVSDCTTQRSCATFLPLTVYYMLRSANVRTVLSDDPLDAEPETDFSAKWPFRVIQGHLLWCL